MIALKIKYALFFMGVSSIFWSIYRLIQDRNMYVDNGYSASVDVMLAFSIVCFAVALISFIVIASSKKVYKENVLVGITFGVFLLSNVNILMDSIVIAKDSGSYLLMITSIVIMVVELVAGILSFIKNTMTLSFITSLLGIISIVTFFAFYFVYGQFNSYYVTFSIIGFVLMLIAYIMLSLATNDARNQQE